jgi:hypothetical protein
MARRQLSHLDLLKLWGWIDKQTLTHTDSIAGLAQRANAELGFDVEKGLGVTENNVYGALKSKNLQIPQPPKPPPKKAPPEPEPEPVPQSVATAAQMQIVADVLVKVLTKANEPVPSELEKIAHPQVLLFQGPTP